VHEIFVVAGDIDPPVGQYVDSLTLLTDLSRMEHGFGRIGIAGYPDGHPLVPSDVLRAALAAKAPMADYLVTQLCFDHATVSSWLHRLRAQGVALPVHVGIAGPVDRRRLLRVATRIGVGQSAQFLRKHRRALVRLATPGSYRPDRLVRELADDLAAPEHRVEGLHVYTLNNVRAAERWRLRTLERLLDVA